MEVRAKGGKTRGDQGTVELGKKWGAGGQREDQLLRPGEDGSGHRGLSWGSARGRRRHAWEEERGSIKNQPASQQGGGAREGSKGWAQEEAERTET